MQDKKRGPASDKGRRRAEIVDRLYDVALDPIRLEELLDAWDQYLGPLRDGSAMGSAPISDPEIEAHVERAAIFLDRYEAAHRLGRHGSVLEQIPRSAAFLSEGGARIAAFNRPAALAFGLREGATLSSLPFDDGDIEALQSAIRKVVSGRCAQGITLRLRSTLTDGPVIARVGPVADPEAPSLALVVSTELVWPEGFVEVVQEAFGLTAAEVEIVRALTLGLPVRDIAGARGRSPETVRTQIRSILAKSETHGQAELIRVVLGLMDAVQPQLDRQTAPPPPAGSLPFVQTRMLRLEARDGAEGPGAGGRRLDWIEFGAPGGVALLYMHLPYGLLRWPASAERAAEKRGFRVIAPVRAGYGGTSPLPQGADHLEGVTDDYLSILDHLGIERCVIIAQGADLRFAMNIASRRPALVKGIIGCSAKLPMRGAEHYARMDKWQRFILANARHAPKLLPFLVQAGFGMAQRLGKEQFFTKVNGGSPGDVATFALPEVREAVLLGTEIALRQQASAQSAFSAECIGAELDWTPLVRSCPARVIMLVAEHDPQVPRQSILDVARDYPHLELRLVPDTGQLLFFTVWPMVLDVVDEILGGNV